MNLSTNSYRLNWRGHPQPVGANTFESVRLYINKCLSEGGCYLWEFEIFDKYGQLKTNIINIKGVDPALTKNYFKLYKK